MILSKVRARVPATTSNLGPGFDCLGLALGLYNELTLELHDETGNPLVQIEGEGRESLPRDKKNLMVKAASLVVSERTEGRLVFKATNRIPLARGLGSSAAAIVAGLCAANRLLGQPLLSEEELLRYAVTLEGHPDNVAPALYGGLVVSVGPHKSLKTYALKPHPELCAVVCVPDFELKTQEARAVLPRTVLREDAVENVARALLLASALERGRWKELSEAMQDRLHQPYRAPLVRGFKAVLRAAREAGACGAALSGAGPSILALGPKSPEAAGVGRAMQKAFSEHRVHSRFLILDVDRKGVRVEKQ